MTGTTASEAEIAVPGQYEITIRVANGEVELCQEDDLINLRPENALKLIRAVLRAIGMDDVHLHKQDGGLCYDVDWPDDRVVTELSCGVGRNPPQRLGEAERSHRCRTPAPLQGAEA